MQIVYTGNRSNRAGPYDFSQIERISRCERCTKLFIQIQDRFFDIEHATCRVPARRPVTAAARPQADNAENSRGPGWVAMQWNPAVRERSRRCCARSQEFDGRIYGINLPESAVDVDPKKDQTGFICDAVLRRGARERRAFARKVFRKSHVVQYVNFWPCEWNNDTQVHVAILRVRGARAHRPRRSGHRAVARPGQMKNSYPFFNRYKDKLQPGRDGRAGADAHVHQSDDEAASSRARNSSRSRDDYLGVDIIFWSVATSPWLQSTEV